MSKREILKLYTDNLKMSAKDLALQYGSTIFFAEECIKEYKISLVDYFYFTLAPSDSNPQVFLLSSGGGIEKQVRKDGTKVHSKDIFTESEMLYIKVHLGCPRKK